MKYVLTAALLWTFLSTPAMAQQSPQFSLPLDCTLGEDCWVANYVDVDPVSDSHKDYKCNAKTYENHQGTDFAIRDRKTMEKGQRPRAFP